MIEDSNLYFMRSALREAERALDKEEVPVGAVVVCNNQIIGKGFNSVLSLNDPTAHAEIIAITSAAAYLNNYILEGCSIYVTLEPCVMCIGAIINAKISNLYFGAFEPKTGACGSIYNIPENYSHAKRLNIISGLLEEESKSMIKTFFLNIRK